MIATGRRLRTEAAGRLMRCDVSQATTLDELVRVMLGWPVRAYDMFELRDALVALLSDDAVLQSDFVNCGAPFHEGGAVSASLDGIRADGEGDRAWYDGTVEDWYRCTLERQEELEVLERRLSELRGEVDRLRDENGHLEAERRRWQLAADEHDKRSREPERSLGHDRRMGAGGLPDGVEWPRFADSAPLRFGDRIDSHHCTGPVASVMLHADSYDVYDSDGEGYRFEYGVPLQHAPYLDADGAPIRVGDTVYGEDGRSWTVKGIRNGSHHPIQAVGMSGRRDLKPGWLSHSRSRTIGSLMERLGGMPGDGDAR